MINLSELNSCKILAEFMANHVPGGIFFGYIDGDTITWAKSSQQFNVELFTVGYQIGADTGTMQTIRENKTIIQDVPRSVYGMRL